MSFSIKVLIILLIWVALLQCSCFFKPVEFDLQSEEMKARTLIDSGLNFQYTANVDGLTEDGGVFTGHRYKSSDGIEINTSSGTYKNETNAVRCFKRALQNVEESDGTGRLFDDTKTTIERRVLGMSKTQGFVLVKLEKNFCSSYFSPSLKHLLAFEMWRDKNKR